MVRVKAAPPAVAVMALLGERVLVLGRGLFTVKVSAGVEVPPPGAGFVAVTDLGPTVAISDAAMVALTCAASTTTASAV
jgi:hypothetical protein